jgi:hypothetical protein
MKFSRRTAVSASVGAVALLASGAGVALTAAPAAALPTACQTAWLSGRTADGEPTGAGSLCHPGIRNPPFRYQRVIVKCKNQRTGATTNRVGPFVQLGEWSKRYCNTGEFAYGRNLETRP